MDLYLTESKAIEFIWFLAAFILIIYALLQRFKWSENIHSNFEPRRKHAYKSANNLPPNQFVIDGEHDEQPYKNSEEDSHPGMEISVPVPSIAQAWRLKAYQIIDIHLVLLTVSILCILNRAATILAVVMVYLYVLSVIILIFLNVTNNWVKFAPNVFLIVLYINYLAVN